MVESRGEPAIAWVDVQYEGDVARAACVVAADFRSPLARAEFVVTLGEVKPYRPGFFFERELPCLVDVLARVRAPLSAIVVDGYVDLDEHGAPGLGAHLYDHFGGKLSVVGVAKRPYRGTSFAAEVLRGSSKSPLFVTARGLSLEDAARRVQGMHGEHRIPTLCKRVDQLARGLVTPLPFSPENAVAWDTLHP